MLVHSVYFHLRPETSPEQLAAFVKGVETLKAIKCVEAVYVGRPAAVALRPVIARDYTVGLTVLCRDIASHDAYQVDPLHKAFLENFRGYWDKVVVYDTE